MAEYHFAQDYLIKRGWQADKDGFFAEWIDPVDSSGHNFRVAIQIQTSRDARRLDTALVALELAQAALEAVTRIGGNLSDGVIEAVGGIHDAKSRALMVVIARTEARRGLEQIQATLKQENKGDEQSS